MKDPLVAERLDDWSTKNTENTRKAIDSLFTLFAAFVGYYTGRIPAEKAANAAQRVAEEKTTEAAEAKSEKKVVEAKAEAVRGQARVLLGELRVDQNRTRQEAGVAMNDPLARRVESFLETL